MAVFLSSDEELDVEKVVLAKRALDVVNHSLGTTPQQVTKLRLVLIACSKILEIATFTALKRKQR